MAARHLLVQQIHRPDLQSLRRLPNCQQSRVLPSALNPANVGAIDTHAFSDSFLAETSRKPIAPDVCSKYFANVHPQDRKQSRI